MNETVKKNFPIDVCLLMWSIKWLCKQISKKKAFFGDKNSFVRILVCTTRVICLTFILWSLTSFFLNSKNFYMPLFGRFLFRALARFPEVNHLRYGPVRIWSIGLTVRTYTCNNSILRRFTPTDPRKVCKLFAVTDGTVIRSMSPMP